MSSIVEFVQGLLQRRQEAPAPSVVVPEAKGPPNLPVVFNSQRNNNPLKEFWDTGGGTFWGFQQCGPTSACMLLSHYLPALANDDNYLEQYIRNCEPLVPPGPAKWAAGIKAKYNWVSGRYTSFMVCHRYAIEQVLAESSIAARMVYREDPIGWRPDERRWGTWADVDAALGAGHPVMMWCAPPPSDGHFLLVVGKTEAGNYIVNDPYGDASKGYEPWQPGDGDHVVYERRGLQHWASRMPYSIEPGNPEKLRILHAI